jgi:baculoviral IAP repeat-containing protein 6
VKADDSKENSKKIEIKLKGEDLDDIDMTYDDKKDEKLDESEIINDKIDITDDKVKDRWSRYIGAMGIEAVAKQA